MQLTFGNMTLELNIFHLSHKKKSVESEMEGIDEVCSVDQNSVKPNVQALQGIANQGETAVRKLPSVATAENLVTPNSISKKQINHGKLNIKAAAQTTAGVEEILLLDPP